MLLLVIATLAGWAIKHLIMRGIGKLLEHFTFNDDVPSIPVMVAQLTSAIPAIVIGKGIVLITELPVALETLITTLATAFVILVVARAVGSGLNAINESYTLRPGSHRHPIKGYLQVGKIVVYCAAAILVISTLIGRSPLLLLSGLGALAAVLMLVFKDTILSLVASVQITSNDMVRVGDWITMRQYDADGDVIDIALHTVKIQNFDKTITTVPTHKLIAEPFQNWRGMQSSGGRRIKRSLILDQSSVRFMTDSEIVEIARFSLLHEYLENRSAEIAASNARLPNGRSAVDRRRMTNLGIFRAYLNAYLAWNPRISNTLTQLVRQLSPGSEGLPLEIYCFTDTVGWSEYETIQADMFDHLIAVLREFDLRLFQKPSGNDVGLALRSERAIA
jgi:miniconductance mechanosensitive channel